MFDREQSLSDVEIKRTDSAENDVFASVHHLYERAWDRSQKHARETTRPGLDESKESRRCLLDEITTTEDSIMACCESSTMSTSTTKSSDNDDVSYDGRFELESEKLDASLLVGDNSPIKAIRTDDASWDATVALVCEERASSCMLC